MQSEHTVFCSYAREDSEFALQLAQDLRLAGRNVWLDQLDIAAGARWDHAIEAALADCALVLVILSPASVESAKVMDEVSYALDEGKRLIPVLHAPCKIPFRLRRFQYLDFTQDYDSGLQHALGELRRRVSQTSEQAAVHQERLATATAVRGTPGPGDTTQFRVGWRRAAAVLVSLVVVAGALFTSGILPLPFETSNEFDPSGGLTADSQVVDGSLENSGSTEIGVVERESAEVDAALSFDLSGAYRIHVKANDRFLHEDGRNDRLVSTRYQPADDSTVFILERQADGSYRVSVRANGRYLHVDGAGDQLLSTRYQDDDDHTRFIFEPDGEGFYRIRVKATNRYWHENGADDLLLSTRHQASDDFTRFRLVPVR